MIGSQLYQVKFVTQSSFSETTNLTPALALDVYDVCLAALQSPLYMSGDSGNTMSIQAVYSDAYTVQLVEATASSSNSITVPSTRTHTGMPYDIFVAPYSASALASASVIATTLIGSGALYDLQRVPYVPAYSGSGVTSTAWTVSGTTFYFISTSDRSGTVTGPGLTMTTDIYDAKVGALTRKWRVVSPNHFNAWDFNPYLNRGVSTTWNYEVTLKPYQPYIHVYPTFKGMYGSPHSNDDRGLICGGSFSLAVSSDAWRTYQIQNSAYADSFARDIENLSTVQDAQRINEIAQIVVGTVQGGVTGYGAGQYLSAGNPNWAAAGAALGAAASLGGGIADYVMNEKLRNEALDYRKDQFGFNLQNIKSRPRILTRTSGYDINNAIFPYVERYVTTTEEENALKRKIKYNGMTIMRIEESLLTILNNADTYKTTTEYVKGKLIREGGYDDTRIFNEIANELFKGIYWEGGSVS